jgi:hypothetical protein
LDWTNGLIFPHPEAREAEGSNSTKEFQMKKKILIAAALLMSSSAALAAAAPAACCAALACCGIGLPCCG